MGSAHGILEESPVPLGAAARIRPTTKSTPDCAAARSSCRLVRNELDRIWVSSTGTSTAPSAIPINTTSMTRGREPRSPRAASRSSVHRERAGRVRAVRCGAHERATWEQVDGSVPAASAVAAAELFSAVKVVLDSEFTGGFPVVETSWTVSRW